MSADPVERLAERAALDAFPSVLGLLDSLTVSDGASSGGQKQLSRARMLHGVISQRFPATKLEDLQKMGVEWLTGMLAVTFPIESEVVDAGFSEAAEAAEPAEPAGGATKRSERLLEALDGGHRWVTALTQAYREAGRLKGVGSAPAAADADGGLAGEPGGSSGRGGAVGVVGVSTCSRPRGTSGSEKLAHAQARCAWRAHTVCGAMTSAA